MIHFLKSLLGLSTRNTKAFLIYIVYFFTINVLTFVLMFVDKKMAIRNSALHRHGSHKHGHHKRKTRIPENVLLSLSIIGGSLGTVIGIWAFRHKTRKGSFTVGVPLLLCINIVVFAVLIAMLFM